MPKILGSVILKSITATAGRGNAASTLGLKPNTDTNGTLEILRNFDSSYIFMNAGTNNDDYKEIVNKDIGLTNNTPVKVKMERIGNTIKTYYDILDGNGYKLLGQLDNFYNGPSRFYLLANNNPPDFPQASAKFDDFKLTCAAVPTPTGGVGNVNLKMKLKFQGINKLPAAGQNSMVAKVKVYKEGLSTPTDGTGTFTADANGVWSGTVPVNLAAVDGKYKILIKGPQHIQKKICDSAPTETSLGIYQCSSGNITLIAGDNDLDLSGIIILVGDLDQNGIVDSVDFGLVKNNLGKTDADTLAKADLNHDGVVDTQDYSLILAALAVRTDEL